MAPKKFSWVMLFLVLGCIGAAAQRSIPEYQPVNYDHLPNFNQGNFFIPQVDWVWLLVLFVVLIIAARIALYLRPPSSSVGGFG